MESLDQLNPPQKEAVLHGGGPLLVFAGAGSGKTRVITHRVAHLVSEWGVAPWRILAVTFTNKAAQEMRERLGRLMPGGGEDLWVGTFHATCARLLRRHAEEAGVRSDFTIYDDQDQKAMVTRLLRDMGIDERQYQPKRVASHINRAKREVVGPDDFEAYNPFTEIVAKVYRAYDEKMMQAGTLDFGDLLYRLVVALENNDALRAEIAGRFQHVLVDEFQDTNHVQYRLVRALCAQHQNLCVVGDDDQSIYGWRGADRRNILDFRKAFPNATVVKLEQNYRSTQRILRVANAIISRNFDREEKELWTDNDEGPQVLVVQCEDERDEARMIVRAVQELVAEGRSLDEVAIFYRTHAQSRVLEEALRASNVSYRIVGGMRFYDRAEVKDVLAYLKVIHNPDDDVSLLRIINTPTRGIGKTTIERLLDAAAQAGTGVWKALLLMDENPSLKPATRKKLRVFVDLVEALREQADGGAELGDLVRAVVDVTGYRKVLQDDDTPEADARLENLAEFVGSVDEFQAEAETPNLASFLELVTLQTSADDAPEGDRVTLMTVHAAKGLEFPAVMVSGMEENVFPVRSPDGMENAEEIEEERRLAYVAFTRARERLVLSWASVRRIYGQTKMGQPSRFLMELPPEDVQTLGLRPSSPAPAYGRSSYGGGRSRSSSYEPEPWSSPASAPRPSGESYVDTSEGSDFADEDECKASATYHRLILYPCS